MHKFIAHILQSVLFRSCAYISLLKPVAFDAPIVGGYQNVTTNIELPLFNAASANNLQEGVLNVLLDYQRAFRGGTLQAPSKINELLQLVDYRDAVASVGILSWLANPDVAGLLGLLCLSHGSTPSSWLLLLSLFLRGLWKLLLILLNTLEFVDEVEELFVGCAFLHVEG